MDTSKQDEDLAPQCKSVYAHHEMVTKKWYKIFLNYAVIIDVIIVIICCAGATAMADRGFLPHTKQGFYCGDPTIAHRENGDTVSSGQLSLVTLVAPAVIMSVIECIRHKDGASWLKILSWYNGMFISLLTFLTFTTVLKLVAGEPRPHFLQSCAPDVAQNCTRGEYITEYRCLNSPGHFDFRILDAYMSFPSGHSGIATMVSIFCTVYILKRYNTVRFGILFKPILSCLVLSWGFVVSLTRIIDRRHHWWDVMAGIVIGITFVTCAIKYHCDLFEITDKEFYGSNNNCSKRHTKIVSRGLSSKKLLNSIEQNTYINM